MNIVVAANVAIAALDPDHGFHRAALRACLSADDVAIVNITRAESLIHPTRMGRFDEVDAELDRLGFVTFALDDGVADRARRLRASYGNRHFPMIDAIVVAFGIEHDRIVVTSDRRWPEITEAGIEVLGPD